MITKGISYIRKMSNIKSTIDNPFYKNTKETLVFLRKKTKTNRLIFNNIFYFAIIINKILINIFEIFIKYYD